MKWASRTAQLYLRSPIRTNIARTASGLCWETKLVKSLSTQSLRRPDLYRTAKKYSRFSPFLENMSRFNVEGPSNVRRVHNINPPTMPHRAFIALGSNLGDRVAMIEKACNEMDNSGVIRVRRTSSLWETKAMYVLDQDNFVNGVCEVSLPNLALLFPNTEYIGLTPL